MLLRTPHCFVNFWWVALLSHQKFNDRPLFKPGAFFNIILNRLKTYFCCIRITQFEIVYGSLRAITLGKCMNPTTFPPAVGNYQDRLGSLTLENSKFKPFKFCFKTDIVPYPSQAEKSNKQTDGHTHTHTDTLTHIYIYIYIYIYTIRIYIYIYICVCVCVCVCVWNDGHLFAEIRSSRFTKSTLKSTCDSSGQVYPWNPMCEK